MARPDPAKIAARFLASPDGADNQSPEASGRAKTAGVVQFVKDRSTGKDEWAWGGFAPVERETKFKNYEFDPKYLKPLARCLRSTLAALGHAAAANNLFIKIKSKDVSPDGNLGGKGYIQKIADIRRAYMNSIEAMSSVADTLYDEINAPHWEKGAGLSNRERDEVKEMMQDAEEIREDPEEWAQEEEREMDEENADEGKQKRARWRRKTAATDFDLEEAYFGRGK